MRKKILYGILCCMLLLVCSGCSTGSGTKDSPGTSGGTKDSSGTSGGTKDVSGTSGGSQAEIDGSYNSTYIEEIKKQGYLTVGCKMDVPDLSFYDEENDAWSGLEIELAYQTAAEVFGVAVDEAKQKQLVKFVGVTVADREEKLENKEVDCLLATYTITDERKERFAFSDSYYTDYIGMMVKTSGDNPNSLGSSDIKSIADLDGKYIGVPRNATTRETFLNYLEMMSNYKSAPIFCEYESYEALFQALKHGNIDVMAVDVSILNGYVDRSTTILNDRFGGQHYGAAVKKENAALLEYVNRAIGN